MVLKTFITIIIISILFACCTQNENVLKAEASTDINLNNFSKLKKIVRNIEKENRIESSHIGEGGNPSKQWNNYEELKQNASVEQLIALTDHKNAAVRCYAFQGLASIKSNKLFPVLIKHLNDTSLVETQSGCLIMTQFVGDYFIEVVTPNFVEIDIYKLNQIEKIKLDSILLNDNSIMLLARATILKK